MQISPVKMCIQPHGEVIIIKKSNSITEENSLVFINSGPQKQVSGGRGQRGGQC